MPTHPDIAQLLAILDRAYNRRSWHGTNLRGSIRGLTPAQALWRPAPARHNIHEVVVHAAYWKYAVCRRLTGEKRGAFPLKGSNWFPREGDPDDTAWQTDVALLERTHLALRDAIALMRANDLRRTSPGSKVSNFELISGIAAHDLYHAGQIQLLKRLRAEPSRMVS
jgi:uncharacterized damage-inducible protein DinB